MVVSNDHSYPQHTSPSNFGHETNPFQSDQMGNFFLHHPLLNQDPYTSIPPLNNEAITSYLSNCSNEAAMAALSSSKKDRHTKIATAQGFRDRRVRLSMDVAREFFGLQDLLGLDKPSKTLGWLLAKSKGAIQELALEKQVLDFHESFSFNTMEDAIGNPSSGIPNRSRRKSYKLEEIEKANYNNINALVVKDNRAKARARARERTRERLIGLSSSSMLVDSKAQVLNQVCDEVESNCLIESHDLSRLVDCTTDYQLGSARVNHLPNLSNPELTFSSFSSWSTFTSPTEMN